MTARVTILSVKCLIIYQRCRLLFRVVIMLTSGKVSLDISMDVFLI